ncbi:MAG TPA: methylmalonyl-CoA epimerase [Acidimicrobiales bacterium]|nr:methylmalonyl-CoA epimerase [Acidimicrobiales bacterium]
MAGPQLTEIDHVAIAVRDLDAAVAWYAAAFGATVAHREVIERDGVEEALLAVADSYVQLLTPIRDDSPVAKFLASRGEGLHHVGYRVDDCGTALAAATATGARSIDAEPRPGSRGTSVAFLHPKSAFGTLIELVEEPAAGVGHSGLAPGTLAEALDGTAAATAGVAEPDETEGWLQ